MSAETHVDVAIVGAGIAGIATAYYLCVQHGVRSVLLIDSRQAMSFTSAQSGDNYRNWWPHPTMADFTNHSIDLMEALADESANIFRMTRRGYALATRQTDVEDLVSEIPPDDFELFSGRSAIRETFPAFSPDIENVVHIRRAGDISGQQLGQYMLEKFRDAGGRKMSGTLRGLQRGHPYRLDLEATDGTHTVLADRFVNAAGPFVGEVAAMLGRELPVTNTFQQKIAFEDTHGAVPRDMPFSIDLDDKQLSWLDEERELLADDPELAWLSATLPGGTHCRPDGGDHGKWVKLGWAYNSDLSIPQEDLANEPKLDTQFPEIVIRGAAAFIPSLTRYIESPPSRCSLYGGYYTMTEENWPLIGPLDDAGAFVVGALSGFGSMAACAAGELAAAWVCDGDLPSYATQLSLARYEDARLMQELRSSHSKGIL